MQYGKVKCRTLLYNTVECSTVQYSAVQHSGNYFEVFHTMGIIVTVNLLKNYFWPATIQPTGSTVSHFFMKNDFCVSESIRVKKKNENEKKVKKNSKTKKSLKTKKEEKKFKNEKYLKCQKLLSSTENFLRTKCRKRRRRRRRGRSRRRSRIELLLLLAEVALLLQRTENVTGTYTGRLDCTVLDCTVQYCTVLSRCLEMQGLYNTSMGSWDILDKRVHILKQYPDHRKIKGGGGELNVK